MKDFIKWLIDEKYKAFFGGAIAGMAPGAIFLLDVPNVSGVLLAWVYFLKLFGAIIYAFYHIIDLLLFFWNYKRTVAVYWFLGLASTTGVILLFVRRLYPPKGGKVKSMI